MNSSSCTNFVYKGWWKKYTAFGIGEAGFNNMIKTTSRGSWLYGTTDYSGQSTTSSSDPGVWSQASTSQTQSTSSWGPCSLLADASELRKLRDLYYAQNKDSFLKELAQGQGQHLEVMAFFGRCTNTSQSEFNTKMQKHYSDLVPEIGNDQKFMDKFDSYLKTDLNCQISNKA